MILRFAASLAAIVILAGLAWWLGLGRSERAIGSADAAMRVAEQALAAFVATGALVASDGAAAIVAGSGGRLALVKRHGARVAVREVTLAAIADGAGGATIDSGERRFGRVTLAGIDRPAIGRLASH